MKISRAVQSLMIAFGCAGFDIQHLRGASHQDPLLIPSPSDRSAPISSTQQLTSELEKMAHLDDFSFIDRDKAYTLPELVDLAQRHNRTTRASWENAVQAAAATGMTAAQFYPLLTVASSYGAGYWNQSLFGGGSQTGIIVPVSLSNNASGGYTSLNAGVNLRYTLFDFGQRIALNDAARRRQLAATLSFNATHQQVTYNVTQAYYTLETDRRLIETAEISAKSADDILNATQAKYDQGIVTLPILLQARQAKAQAAFDLINARSNRDVALLNLIQAIGADPQCGLKVAPANFTSLGKQLDEPLTLFVQSALNRKPDLLARVASAQAAQASLRAAKAAPLPKFSLIALQNYEQFNTTVQGSTSIGGLGSSQYSDHLGLGLQNYGAFVNVEWPVFNGGLDRNKIKEAQSSWREATEEALLARDQAVADVWRSYISAKAAIASRESAMALITASQASYDALRESYGLGRTPIQDVLTARSALAQAMATQAQADEAIAASLATLTYSSGQL